MLQHDFVWCEQKERVRLSNYIKNSRSAPGGTGKTFLLNLILAEVRKSGNVTLASSGVAASVLHGGRTAHSALKLPINLNLTEEPICNIIDNPSTCKLLKQTNVIIWDECTMANKKGPEALDKTLQDLKKNNFIMGKVIVILAGDFRQTLPIISRGTPADQIHACLKNSYLWKHVKIITLKNNMRVFLTGDTNLENFSR